jgi:hypothetical protein
MTLLYACKIAEECGLKTIGEAIDNAELYPYTFSLEQFLDEMDELRFEVQMSGLALTSNINKVLSKNAN